MGIEEFLRDPGSTTGYFSQLTDDYKLEILHHGINGDSFERIIAIYLDKVPCMLAVSRSKIEFPLFLDILQNAKHVPIGTRLFAPDSGISRINLQITKATTKDIYDAEMLGFMHKMNYTTDEFYCRKSDFMYQEQIMHLDEYCLPGLIDILANSKI